MTRILMLIGLPLVAVTLFAMSGIATTNPSNTFDAGSHARRGADDGPGHDANDDRGGHGADDAPDAADAPDDNGIDAGLLARRGADDAPDAPDAPDDNGGHGADDAPDAPDAPDDNGGGHGGGSGPG